MKVGICGRRGKPNAHLLPFEGLSAGVGQGFSSSWL